MGPMSSGDGRDPGAHAHCQRSDGFLETVEPLGSTQGSTQGLYRESSTAKSPTPKSGGKSDF